MYYYCLHFMLHIRKGLGVVQGEMICIHIATHSPINEDINHSTAQMIISKLNIEFLQEAIFERKKPETLKAYERGRIKIKDIDPL